MRDVAEVFAGVVLNSISQEVFFYKAAPYYSQRSSRNIPELSKLIIEILKEEVFHTYCLN